MRRQTQLNALKVIRQGYTLKRGAEVAGTTYNTLLGWRQNDPLFAAEVAEAMLEGNDRLHEEAVRRAAEGVQEPVFYQGQVSGYITRYSDRLLEFLMSHRDKQFRSTQDINIRTPDGVDVRSVTLTADEASELYGAIMRDEMEV